jgi:SAM-dependent methyltransferase
MENGPWVALVRGATAPVDVDPWELYERSVQAPLETLALLEQLHGGAPRFLAEHFAGSAALARAWVASRADRSALAIDLDSGALERARGVERLDTRVADVREARHEPADIVHAGNFSLGYLHTRAELLDYLRAVREQLRPQGLFACDTYGGASAFQLGAFTRVVHLPGAVRLTSIWERRAADPRNARVENVLGFRVERDGELVLRIAEAFVYRWRLWSIPELGDALEECGFEAPRVRATTAPEDGEVGAELGADWAVMLASRARP